MSVARDGGTHRQEADACVVHLRRLAVHHAAWRAHYVAAKHLVGRHEQVMSTSLSITGRAGSSAPVPCCRSRRGSQSRATHAGDQRAHITETNRIQLVLFGMQNRTLRSLFGSHAPGRCTGDPCTRQTAAAPAPAPRRSAAICPSPRAGLRRSRRRTDPVTHGKLEAPKRDAAVHSGTPTSLQRAHERARVPVKG
jgi:hypothetical protein